MWDVHRNDVRDRSAGPWFLRKRATHDAIITALAHKRGETPEQTLEFLTAKAQQKFKRDYQ